MRSLAAAIVVVMVGALASRAEMSCTTKGNVTNCETGGNLAPTQDRGCIAVDQADRTMSPADLAVSILACAKGARPQDAAELMILMLARGRFDTMRVADASAHQAVSVISIELGAALNPSDEGALNAAFAEYSTDLTGPAFRGLCTKISALGVPAHDPGYMIAHGMGAVLGEAGDGLVANFDAAAAWQDVLHGYLKCPG